MTSTAQGSTHHSLDPVKLAGEARRQAGVDPERPLRFLDGLSELANALDGEARLTDAGRQHARRALVAALVTQLRVDRLSEHLPPLTVRPVFITGLLRTGTTFLHNLLSQHPEIYAPPLWRMMAPADRRPPGVLIEECANYVAEYYRAAPDFRAIHPLDPMLPEECHRLSANTFRHFIYGVRYRVPSYLEWLERQSVVPAYRYHREQLRCIMAADSPGRHRTVVLKCPSHLWHLDSLARVYPGATVIRLHRQPSVAVASVCSLTATVRAARSSYVDRAEIGRYWRARADAVLPGMRRDAAGAAVRVIDVRYPDLVSDPLGVAEQVCAGIGLSMGAAARQHLSVFADKRNATAARTHRYRAEDFGLTAADLDQRYAGYRAEFDLD